MVNKRSDYRHIILLGAAIALFVFSVFSDKVSFVMLRQYTLHKRFQEDLYSKEFQLDDLLDEWEDEFEHFNVDRFFNDFITISLNEATRQGISLYIFDHDTLKFWSDNTIHSDYLFQAKMDRNNAMFLGNGWFIKKEKLCGDITVLGLIRIKSDYTYENKFLENRFNSFFSLPSETIITLDQESRFPVYSSLGEYLFSLDFENIDTFTDAYRYLCIICYFAGILLFLLAIRIIVKSIEGQLHKNIGLILFTIILILSYALIVKIKVPSFLESVLLFSPAKFASSNWLPSLANLLITAFFIFFLAFNFYNEFQINSDFFQKNKIVRYLFEFLYILLLAVFFQTIIAIFHSLILNSSITFEIYKVLSIDVYTFTGLFVLALLFSAWALLLDKFITVFRHNPDIINLLIYSIALGILIIICGFILNARADIIVTLFAVAIAIIMAVIRSHKNIHYKYSTFVLLLLIFSILSVYKIILYSSEKELSIKKILAIDLSSEHDPIAELLLKEMQDDLAGDEMLGLFLHERFIDETAVYDHLIRRYFSGFWEKYDLQFTICSPADSVYVEPPEDRVYHCYQFFNNLISRKGMRITDSRFYFIDNLNGKISYFTYFDYFSPDSLQVLRLFLELDSKLISRELGYPELLLSQDLRKSLPENYSYAKYHKGELITQSGNYSYSNREEIYTTGKEEFELLRQDGYDHMVYNIDENNAIILSHPSLKVLDVIITFTYIFAFFYLLLTLNLLIINIPFLKKSLQLNIKNKIQYSMIMVIFISLLVIASGTIYFSARQYKKQHFDNLSERIQSVYVELMHKLAFEPALSIYWHSEGYQSLDELLQKFSNVFYTDINLYDADGDLLASSRPEIFYRGLTGTMMHPEAFRELAINSRNEYVHEERIGSLKYLSAYVPFKNNDNILLAYLNLPYFSRQDALTREISNLVVAIVNFYVLLISVSILLAVFLSNKITQPLRMIQSKISTFTLGKTNEKIQYNADDEIGSLVREYNHLVDELAHSAELLARSERESAWREMAKQIAHEIKNPLTPMRLSVQHLQRSIKNDTENWEKNLTKITGTLIEQIDELSAIATEFSNFAKMPRANNEEVDLGEKMTDVASLFSNTANVDFELQMAEDERVIVFADKEQLSRVFINLIKNGIQSIPDERKGHIRMSLETDDDYVLVNITDNGKGIPEELGDKLFQPNFTTKSSGMGMGLAIVKSIIENANGTIEYKTELGKGTTFIIKLPIFKIVYL